MFKLDTVTEYQFHAPTTLPPGKESLGCTEQDTGWLPEPVGTFYSTDKLLSLKRTWSLCRYICEVKQWQHGGRENFFFCRHVTKRQTTRLYIPKKNRNHDASTGVLISP